MFGEECTLPMDVGLPRQDPDLPDPIMSLYAVWVCDTLEVAYDQVRLYSGQAVRRQKRLYDRRAVRRLFAVGDWVLRYSATRVGRSRRADGRILEDTDVPWGHQVAIMFQIVSALALEVPAFLHNIENLWGVSPDVQLSCKPWGHVDHSGGGCGCLSSYRTGARFVPHDKGVFACVGTGGRFCHYRGKWCADQPCIWYRSGVAGIGAIRVSSTRRLWPPAPGCVCAVEDGHVGGI